MNYDVNPAVAKRVMAGEDFDVGLNNPWYVEEMITHGRVIPDIHVPFGRVPLTIGAAVPEPGRSPVRTRPCEACCRRGFDRLHVDRNEREDVPEGHRNDGLAGSDPQSPASDGGWRAAVAVAKGEVQYAIAPLSRIIAAPGVAPVATLPSELGLDIDMSMFVHRSSRRLNQPCS